MIVDPSYQFLQRGKAVRIRIEPKSQRQGERSRLTMARPTTPGLPRPAQQSSTLYLLFHCNALAVAALLGHRFPAGTYAANPTGGANQLVPLVLAAPTLEAGAKVVGG